MRPEDWDAAYLWDMLSKARQLSSATIPWSDIVGQRNILAHEYGQIDCELLYMTATQDIPALTVAIEMLLR